MTVPKVKPMPKVQRKMPKIVTLETMVQLRYRCIVLNINILSSCVKKTHNQTHNEL